MSHHRHAADQTEKTEEHDLGLAHDLPRIMARRGLLGLLGGVGAAAALTACGADDTSGTTGRGQPPNGAPPGGMDGDSSVEVAEGEIPEETAGPYPGDGSNGPDVLGESGVVRSDITSSFGSGTGVAEGIATTVRLKVYDLDGDEVTPLAGAAVYLWHCDREGRYSMYDDEIAEENYLRGVQAADADGAITFTTIFPACYAGRWPHMHFEVYESLDAATGAADKLRTSQLALPEDVCRDVYASEGYEQSVQNLAQLSLETDGVFSDGYSLQLAKVTGSVEDGYTVSLNVPV
ncbi:dioxygenase family protein [Nocardioides daeguensis]|uniref:Intradiol ring-cleavage dioxygenases domain-containing protein n=1 Tax=Nocardioides daeguensis TaxID=908359 RepID=A0ABP6VM85_9ACTN|nr:3,4-dioxygenase subunit beta [Nocardioides daeguensis]MBV6727430.1 3,4-dioxygenase subunit beta [Nocardioides daeguensis]MCR1775520.1 3,4-dioxygenase subunit beta [Nocardioides daeguensis]